MMGLECVVAFEIVLYTYVCMCVYMCTYIYGCRWCGGSWVWRVCTCVYLCVYIHTNTHMHCVHMYICKCMGVGGVAGRECGVALRSAL